MIIMVQNFRRNEGFLVEILAKFGKWKTGHPAPCHSKFPTKKWREKFE
jgi:hypothetical protein